MLNITMKKPSRENPFPSVCYYNPQTRSHVYKNTIASSLCALQFRTSLHEFIRQDYPVKEDVRFNKISQFDHT